MAWIDPDIAAFRDLCKARSLERATFGLAERRASFETEMGAIPLAPGCTTERLDLGGVASERIVHAGALPGRLVLYFHGGGHVFGNLATHRHLVSRLAVAAAAPAIHVDYRLAPEHPYPAGLDDAVAAYRAVLATGIAPAAVVVGGESAGANLAAALLLKARDLGLPQPGGLYLLSPWLDMTASADPLGAGSTVMYVRDIDAAVANAKKAHAPIVTTGGAPVEIATAKGKARSILLRDPDGFFVQLVEEAPAPGAPEGNVHRVSLAYTMESAEATLKFYGGMMGVDLSGPSPFSKDPAMLKLVGAPAGTEFRKLTTVIPGPPAAVEFTEFRGVPRTKFHLRVRDPGAPAMAIQVDNLIGMVAWR